MDMLDTNEEMRKTKALLGSLIALLVGGLYSCEEIRYQMHSRTAVAHVRKVTETTGDRKAGRAIALKVDFFYLLEDGTERMESDFVPRDWSSPMKRRWWSSTCRQRRIPPGLWAMETPNACTPSSRCW